MCGEGRRQGGQLVSGRGLGRRKNYEKWGVSKKNVIKQRSDEKFETKATLLLVFLTTRVDEK